MLEFYCTVDSQNSVTHTINFYELVNCKNYELLTVWAFYQFIVRRQEFHKQSSPVQQTYVLQYTKRNQLGFPH